MSTIREIKKKIIPRYVLYKRKIFLIENISPQFTISGYRIKTYKNQVFAVYLDDESIHPNCNPVNQEFCLSPTIMGKQLNDTVIKEIENLLEIMNLDHCYYRPWEHIKMREVGKENL